MKFHWKIIPLVFCLLAVLFVFGFGQAAPSSPSALVTTRLPMVFRDFSATADQVAFIGADPNNFSNQFIYLFNIDSGEQHTLTVDPATIFNLVWSPNGSKIAFSAYRDNNTDIYVMNPDGTGLTRLTDSLGLDISPTWSNDGSRIAFISNRQDSSQLYVMGADGSNVTRLTNLTPGCTKPNWSPDGTRIAFDLFGDSMDDEEIYVINADGSGLLRLTDNAFYDTVEDWSPDSSKILFLSDRLSINSEDVFVMNADGTDLFRLSPYGTVTEARWSPDGFLVAYASFNFPLSVILSDGSLYNPLQCGSESIQAVDLAWSPGGSYLAFSPISGSYLANGIYVVSIDETICVQLTSMRAWGPQWRPDK